MKIIKYIMLFILFILSVEIGRYKSKQYTYRLNELQEIRSALNMLKTKIKFTYEPIPEIFGEISNKLNSKVSDIFVLAKMKMDNETASVSWEKSVEEYKGSINNEDKLVIKSLSKLLRRNRY